MTDPARAFDRLAAIKELLDDLAEAEEEAIIAARMAKVSWSEIGRAYGGMTRQGAFNKWGAMVNRFEAAGLLDTQVFHTYECLDCGWQAIREDQLTASWATEDHTSVTGHETYGYSPGTLPDPVDPIIGEPELGDARTWCRWCGHRLVKSKGSDGWQHHTADARAGDGYLDDVDCPGPQPWPKDHAYC